MGEGFTYQDGNTRRPEIRVNEYQGRTRVHIRNYNKNAGEETFFPTKQGVALSLEEWNALVAQVDEVTNHLNQFTK